MVAVSPSRRILLTQVQCPKKKNYVAIVFLSVFICKVTVNFSCNLLDFHFTSFKVSYLALSFSYWNTHLLKIHFKFILNSVTYEVPTTLFYYLKKNPEIVASTDLKRLLYYSETSRVSVFSNLAPKENSNEDGYWWKRL